MRTVNGVIIRRMDDVQDAHRKSSGGHWFDPGALRFFSSRIGEKLYGERYFVSSEQGPSGVRRYSVRELTDDGDIETVGEFQEYATREAAHRAAMRAAGE